MQTEPSANHRLAALELWQTYCALLQQGFDRPEAIYLTGQVVQKMWHYED